MTEDRRYHRLFTRREIRDDDLRQVNPEALDQSNPNRLPAPDFSRTHAKHLPGQVAVFGDPGEWGEALACLAEYVTVLPSRECGPLLYAALLFCRPDRPHARAAASLRRRGVLAASLLTGPEPPPVHTALAIAGDFHQAAACRDASGYPLPVAVCASGNPRHRAAMILSVLRAARIAPGAAYHLPVPPPAAVA